MPSEATQAAHAPSDSAANLRFYRTRDQFVRAYLPATEEERLLLDHMAQAHLHLEEVYEFRSQITAEKGLFGLFKDDLETYKLVLRTLSEAERMWRHAVQEFQRARRHRDKLASPRRSSVGIVPSTRPAAAEIPEPPQTPPVNGQEVSPDNRHPAGMARRL